LVIVDAPNSTVTLLPVKRRRSRDPEFTVVSAVASRFHRPRS
jgi:hypothetical protein